MLLGKFVQQPQGFKAYIPDVFPPKNRIDFSPEVQLLVTDATLALGRGGIVYQKILIYNIFMHASSFERLQPFFNALGNKDRFSVMCLLSGEPRTVTELYEALGVKQNKISNDLKHLRECGYVTVEKQGNVRLYAINPAMQELLVTITKQVQELTNVCEACLPTESENK